MYSSLSLLLTGDNSLVEVLRCLTSIELFLHPEFYGKHSCFDLAFKSQKNKKWPLNYYVRLSLKIQHWILILIIGAVKNEAILNCRDFEWSSFIVGKVVDFTHFVTAFLHGKSNCYYLVICLIAYRTASLKRRLLFGEFIFNGLVSDSVIKFQNQYYFRVIL